MLTDMLAKNAKPREKGYKLVPSENGMYLWVAKSGSKVWRIDYSIAGKRKTFTLGRYPKITLAEARKLREDVKDLVREGIDPGAQKKLSKIKLIDAGSNTFELVAREWQERHLSDKSNSHSARSISLLENDLLPSLGRRPINEIEAVELLQVLRKVESRSVDMAHRARALSGQIFRYGAQTGRCSQDPSINLRGALKSKVKKHYAAIIDPEAFGQLILAIDAYSGSLAVKNALKLAPLLMLRPGNLRALKWSNVNWEKSQLEYSAEEMKTKDRPHIVPLPSQAIEILEEQQMKSGKFEYVFPCQGKPKRPLSDNGLRTALLTMGYSSDVQTVHGFRSSARTIMEEELGIPPHLLEHQLHHKVKDANGMAYNRTTHLEARREMLQNWADYLDKLKV